jgi:transketolase
MVQTALAASAHWPGSAVWSAPSLKPLDAEAVTALCGRHQALVVLEEHSVHGGLGSAVAEITSASAPIWVARIGIQDRFSRYCGSYDYLMKEHGLDLESVVRRVSDFVARLPEDRSRGGEVVRALAAAA